VWRERLESDASPAAVVEAARAELALGRPDRALALLSEHPVPDTTSGGAAGRVFAVALYQQGEFANAAVLFERLADYSAGRERGVLLAQAGEAFEQAGRLPEAAELYLRATGELPEIRGWLSLRRAGAVRDTGSAFRILRDVPSHGRRLADGVRADVLLRVGDSARAVPWLARAGRVGEAAKYAFSSGDPESARRYAYEALEINERDVAAPAIELAREALAPSTLEEYNAFATALWRFEGAGQAARLLTRAAAAYPSNAALYVRLGRTTAQAGDRLAAQRHYERSLALEPSAEIAMLRARTLMGLNQNARARTALRQIVADFPAEGDAALALYLLADMEQDAGRTSAADSMYRIIADVWPDDERASSARFRLANHALDRADTAAAIAHFRAEGRHSGERAGAARFQAARLTRAMGDAAGALAQWAELSRDDSLGYYGTIARAAAGLPAPVFGVSEPNAPNARVQAAFDEYDLLSAIGFSLEADVVLSRLQDDDLWTLDELLDIAEGLNQRGHTIEGIRLGWRISRYTTLNNPRVVRIIFPYPNREQVEREAAKFELDPYLVAGLIRQESAFDPHATSRAGARGLMQLMPSTARWLAGRLDIEWDNSLLGVADANMHVGMAHLSALLRQYKGELIPSLAAYNAGGRPVARWLRFPEANDPFLFVERIPYVETRGYVRTLLRNRELYAALYGSGEVPIIP
jgi:soluble lytic murein transglycosylase